MATKRLREINEQYIVDEKGKRVGVVLDSQVYEKLVAELESLRAKNVKPHPKRGKNGVCKSTAPRVAKNNLSERERAIKILKDAGMLAELTPEEKAMAAEWRALPEERKRHVIDKLNSLHLDPPLSQIIHDERR